MRLANAQDSRAREEWWCYMPVARFFGERSLGRMVTLARERTWNHGHTGTCNGRSRGFFKRQIAQPVHLTNRTSNANKQPPIAGAISFAEAKAALPRLPFACSFASSSSLVPLFLLFLQELRVSGRSAAWISRCSALNRVLLAYDRFVM